ncbi:MAG: hypothetical protein ACQETH_01290 [Candidatus Rifleibacteriota bacterium]
MKKRLTLLTLAFIAFSASMLQAENVDFKTFLRQKLEVWGLAGTPWNDNEYAFDRERSRAWMDALHHAYEEILDLPLMQDKLVRHVLQTNPALKERLGFILLSAEKTFYQPDNTGMARCRIEIPFNGKHSLRSALYLAALRPQPQKPTMFLASYSAGLAHKDLPNPEFKKLILDVRDYYFEPSVFPRIFAQGGELLFQEAMSPQPERFSRPAIIYSDDIVAARKDLKEQDYMISRAYVTQLAQRDVTVDQTDAEIVAGFCRQLTVNPEEERQIVIVFDPEKEKKQGLLPLKKSEEKNKKTIAK